MSRQPDESDRPPSAKGETLRFAGKTDTGRYTPEKDRHGTSIVVGSIGAKHTARFGVEYRKCCEGWRGEGLRKGVWANLHRCAMRDRGY